MLKQIEGSRAIAETVAYCRPAVICAYPITPQTHIVEGLSALSRSGDIEDCKYINVESEFAALSVAIGASACGARAYTATSSQGLLYMAEAVYNAAGLGLPIVMTLGTRALGAPLNIWNDHSDAMSLRDAGWIQLFAETNQEAVDLHIQAFRIAEAANIPVMVCVDGFILTHAVERVDVPSRGQVDAFLPPFVPSQTLDPNAPVSIGVLVGPDAFTEVKALAHKKMLRSMSIISETAAAFKTAFGRDSGGFIRSYRTEDAETIVVAMGSVVGDPAEQAVAAAAINTVQLMCGAFGAGLAGVVVNLSGSPDAAAGRWMFGPSGGAPFASELSVRFRAMKSCSCCSILSFLASRER